MDESCELGLLTEIVSVRELWKTAFYWTLWDLILHTIKKKTDREQWQEIL